MSGLLAAREERYITRQGVAATLYDTDGVSALTDTTLVLSSAQNLGRTGARGDILLGRVPAALAAIGPGSVLAAPALAAGWYLVIHTLDSSLRQRASSSTTLALLALPGTLTVQRAVASTPPLRTNPYSEPAYLTSAGYPAGDTAEVTVRCGVSNQFDPLSESIAGPLPAGVVTVYVPLGADVRKDDGVVDLSVPGTTDTTAYVVQQVNRLYADGTAYALQLILDSGAGAGWAPSS